KNGALLAARMESGTGAFSPTVNFSLPAPATLGQYRMEVAKGGDVVIAYAETGADSTNLWAVRYRSGAGWGTPQLLEDRPEDVVAFDLEIDEGGNAFVLYELGEMAGNDSYFVS